MKQFMKLFNKVGGTAVLKQYLKAHVLLFALIQTLCQGFSKKSMEIVRLSINNRILGKLRKRHKREIEKFVQSYEKGQQEHSNKVWVCWLQGIENAPELVKKCYQSLQNNLVGLDNSLQDREIVLLTEDNYREYTHFPDYIQQKIAKGVITKTHMSDLIRLELLIRHGGTWIDATVFCSGKNIPTYMLDSDLFFYQLLKPGRDGQSSVLSSWFMTSCTNNPILLLTRELLYKYWRKNDSMIDYFLLHDFFQLALEAYPEEWNQVIPRDNSAPHVLLLRLFEQFDEELWNSAIRQSCFHKLSYKFSDTEMQKKNTYYDVIINKNPNITH